VCLLYIALGFMLASLQRTVLQEIVHRQARASSVIRHRRRLIGTLFHDLANPLQALAMQVEPPEGGEATSPSDAPPVPTDAAPLVQRMRATLDAALGQLQPPERLTPAALVDALLAVFGARLAEKRIHLVPVWEPEAAVVANRSLLQDTILANLLSNAIKFTPVGGTITLRGERAGPVVHLEIADQGPGLPEAVRTAFEAGRVAPSRSGTAGEIGSGYGLLLVREYLREMGGTLAFEPPSHGGLVARVVLPAG
jgi:signal transduction histidine kinase